MAVTFAPAGLAQAEPLASWKEGPQKRAIVEFITAVTSPGSPDFIPEKDRIATFDMDGTLWVEQPAYPEVVFAFDRLAERAKAGAAFAGREPFSAILAVGAPALHSLGGSDADALLNLAMSGMAVTELESDVRTWLTSARQRCWDAPHLQLVYQPMREVLTYFREHGFRNYIVTGSGQDFARVLAEEALGMPPEQVIGTARLAQFAHDGSGGPELIAGSDIMFEVADAGKPEAIHLFIGQRPAAAFGNSGGDADMLDYVTARAGRSLAMLVLHDDAVREYAYGPALGLPDTGIGVFDQALYDRARKAGWGIISMRDDWRDVLAGARKTAALGAGACAIP